MVLNMRYIAYFVVAPDLRENPRQTLRQQLVKTLMCEIITKRVQGCQVEILLHARRPYPFMFARGQPASKRTWNVREQDMKCA